MNENGEYYEAQKYLHHILEIEKFGLVEMNRLAPGPVSHSLNPLFIPARVTMTNFEWV